MCFTSKSQLKNFNNVFGTFKEVERIGSTQSIAKA